MCKDAIGVHLHVLIHTSAAMYDDLRKAICSFFEIVYYPKKSTLKVAPNMTVVVHTDNPFRGHRGGLMILFHTDNFFDHHEYVSPLLNDLDNKTSLCMFSGSRLIIGDEGVLREFINNERINFLFKVVIFILACNFLIFVVEKEWMHLEDSFLFLFFRSWILNLWTQIPYNHS